MPASSIKTVENIIADCNSLVKSCILATFDYLSTDAVVSIITDFNTFIERKLLISKEKDNKEMCKYLVFFICLKLLSNVDIDGELQHHQNNCITEYRLWLFLDAVSTKVALWECLGEISTSQEIAKMMISYVFHRKENMYGSNKDIKIEQDDEYDHDHDDDAILVKSTSFLSDIRLNIFLTLPDICRSVILAIACRMPLVEKELGLVDIALESFRKCISGDSLVKAHVPVGVQLGLKLEAAMLMLQRAQQLSVVLNRKSMREGGMTGVEEIGGLDYLIAPAEIKADIDHAFSLLSAVHHVRKF